MDDQRSDDGIWNDIKKRYAADCAAGDQIVREDLVTCFPQYELQLRELFLNKIIAVYLEARDAEKPIDPEEHIARYPQYELQFRSFLEAEDAFQGFFFDPTEDIPELGDGFEELEIVSIDGGQGIVYKAYQKGLERHVAIKVARAAAARRDPEGLQREGKKAAKLRHAHIVQAHDFGVHKEHAFLVMDYIEGGSLAQLIGQGPQPPEEVAKYMVKIADAIHHAHQELILHCDLKPANVLLRKQFDPVVTDFGLAKLLDEDGKYEPYAVAGTAAYMAPEQAARKRLSFATDVYGLGAILYALLTGKPPFVGDTREEILEKVLEETPEPPSKKNSLIAGHHLDIEAICLKCLSKEPGDRYGSARELASDLERYLGGKETTARRWKTRERPMRWCRRNPVTAALVAMLVLSILLTITMSLSIELGRRAAQITATKKNARFAAKYVAKVAFLRFLILKSVVRLGADDSTLGDLIEDGPSESLHSRLKSICIPQFTSCSLFDRHGMQVAGVNDNFDGQSSKVALGWRDYFLGAKAHPREKGDPVHLSKIYVSVTDGLSKVGLSAAVFNERGEFGGVLLAAITSRTIIGIMDVEDPVSIVGPRDVINSMEPSQNADGELAVLFHSGYESSTPYVSFRNPWPQISTEGDHAHEFDDSDLPLDPNDQWEDPLGTTPEGSLYTGRWVAGFAPVGKTGLVAVVQHAYYDARRLDPLTQRRLITGGLSVGILAMASLFFSYRLRVRRPDAQGIQ